MKPKIFFFVPVFNEQETVGILLYRISQIMKKLRYDYQVILTLDACTDESPLVTETYLKVMPLRVIDHETRKGYGASLNEAIRVVLEESENPKRDFFMIVDGDFAVDPTYLEEMSQQIERNVDLYTGNTLDGTGRLGLKKRLAHWLTRKVLAMRGREPDTGTDLLTTFRGCRVHLLKRVENELAALDRLRPSDPPQAASLIFLKAILPHSRKFMELAVAERVIRRRPGRFSLFRLLRFLLFTDLLTAAPRGKAAKLPSTDSGRRRGRGKEPTGQDQKGREDKSASMKQEQAERPPRGRRSRRRRPAADSGAGKAKDQPRDRGGQKRDKDTQSSGRQPQPAAEKKERQEQKEDQQQQQPKKSRRRRRRRSSNKARPDSSNQGDRKDT